MQIELKGKMSTFGGPDDGGVRPDEGLALITEHNQRHFLEYLLPTQPPGTTGLARRLNPSKFYIACRWDYSKTPAAALQTGGALTLSPLIGDRTKRRPTAGLPIYRRDLQDIWVFELTTLWRSSTIEVPDVLSRARSGQDILKVH
jgi:hypothetical protein